MFRCPDCGSDMKKRIVVTRLGDFDGWSCIDCDSFYKYNEIKKAIFTV